ncbi:MAG TPA: 3-hydroxyacyl-CoA dehydrogenase NAD-binding domain-containing protein [Blastocatellia bacterium]|nr:3-hydroxyacyl-CoA dehydrogenase NAD-binding domain-containing protein [Blastocatellia bacterium]HMV82106.1 3-hydroxyacyl-CoA dehydrogenase NAD-binding domain-containing protein [Blastocatellia bacterium]HMX24434.1 3-hydroxyacyl-CoA dehydrogenase NAD-binding domain-containing protein [Blastocatellia bacterium]HNG29105.1 3-hydroxyacyl-CoA dehydrogenase NAD-binding domain-containing protein [Blastocatellia bacterium]
MSELVTLSRAGEIAVITVNNPPVNALSPGVPEGIAAAIAEVAADNSIKGAVMIGAGQTFIAGADIKEFGKITSGQRKEGINFLDVIKSIEDCPKPTVAAIHGTAFGGGLEVAMGFHYRVAVASAQVGQPEVKLGLIPGAAGTQRLPRLAGVAKAVQMCADGNPVSAKDALAAGIIDRIVEGDLLEGALAFVREKLAAGEQPPKTRERNEKLGDEAANTPIFEAARAQAKKSARGLLAPQAAIDAVEAATKLSFDEGVAYEKELFQKCLFSDQSKAMIHVFFGDREVQKIPGIGKDVQQIEIKKAAIIGAGTMGGGIAMNYANAGIPVILKETTQEALDRGVATIRKNYQNSVNKGRFPQAVMDKRMALITPQLSYDGFEEADIITEAVFEGMALKKEVFAELDKIAKPGAILASNTSTLDIDEIASATSRPEFVIGHHYFSPANVMRLLEIVRGQATSKEVIATSMSLAKRLKKVGVLVGNCYGFVGNRMLHQYGREAQFLVEEGAKPQDVDGALYKFGMAMGPLAVGDLAGLDVGWRIRKEFKHLEKPGLRYPKVADELCERGRYGQKTGAGWYKYDENRKASPDPEVEALIEQIAAEAGITRRTVTEEEILERTQYALINEGAKILAEGIALRAVDIDIVYINGYGYPAWRGGPMWYADTVGLKKVYDRVCEFHAEHGEWWTPAPLLKELAEAGKTFAEYDKQK